MSNSFEQTLQGISLIGDGGGEKTSEVFHGINPATGEALDPPYHGATTDETSRAAKLASEAFATYRSLGGVQRGAFLRKIAEHIEALGITLTERVTQETALFAARASGERDRTCAQLRMFAQLVEEGSWVNARIDRGNPARQPLPKPDTRWMLQALGPVAVIGPSNFPLAYAVAGGDTASALAAGCPVVVKAHPSHPGTSEFVGRAIRRAVEECGLPAGVFSLLFDPGKEVGSALVRHPAIKAVGFTGSPKAGRALFDLAAARPDPIPFFGEMGSLNPIFILPGAFRERGRQIAEGLQASVILGMGQFCTNPGLVLMEKGASFGEFVSQMTALMAKASPGVMLNRGIRASYNSGLERLIAHSHVETLLAGDSDPGSGGAQSAPGLFQTDASTFLGDATLAEEVFGPATILVQGTRGELLRVAVGLEGHLTATVHGTDEDFKEYRDLIALLETKVGRLIFNGYPTGLEVCASTHHGGPWPATTDARFTSVGTAAIYRFARPICYQNCPQTALPPELRDGNPNKIWRLADEKFTQD